MEEEDADYSTETSDSEVDLDEFGDVRKKVAIKKTKKPGANPEDEEENEEEDEEEEMLEEDLDIDDQEEEGEEIEDDMEYNVEKRNATFGDLHPDGDVDDDDDEEEDENYLQKFGENIEKNIIRDYHPELKVHNFEQITAMCKVVRDDQGNIIDPLHKTVPFVTKYEKARILGERAKQINSGAEPFIEVDESLIEGYLIALKEYDDKKIPFILQRPLPNGESEYWRLKDLEMI